LLEADLTDQATRAQPVDSQEGGELALGELSAVPGLDRQVPVARREELVLDRVLLETQEAPGLLDAEALLLQPLPGSGPDEAELLEPARHGFERDEVEVGEAAEVPGGRPSSAFQPPLASELVEAPAEACGGHEERSPEGLCEAFGGGASLVAAEERDLGAVAIGQTLPRRVQPRRAASTASCEARGP